MNHDSKIFVAGSGGVAGSAIVRCLMGSGYQNLVCPTHRELDLTSAESVENFWVKEKPEYVFLTAAKMGSIIYRKEHPADILEENLRIQLNVIGSAHRYGVKKLLFMSSDFIYPNSADGVLRESDFLTNAPGEKDLPYSLVKITGVKLCDFYRQQYGDNFFTVVPCAFFGENASFELDRASVVAALIRRFYEAKVVEAKELVLWGSGKPVKEFLLSDDVADACVYLMENYDDGGLINIGAGDGGHTIMETAQAIRQQTGFAGGITCDLSKPDGIMRRVMDTTKLKKLGWEPRYTFSEALSKMYSYFLSTKYAKQ